jgi:hypothetical protein
VSSLFVYCPLPARATAQTRRRLQLLCRCRCRLGSRSTPWSSVQSFFSTCRARRLIGVSAEVAPPAPCSCSTEGSRPVFLIKPPHTGTRALKGQGLAFLWPGTRVSTNPHRGTSPLAVLSLFRCRVRTVGFVPVVMTVPAEFCMHAQTCMHAPEGPSPCVVLSNLWPRARTRARRVPSCYAVSPPQHHAPAHTYPSSRRTQGRALRAASILNTTQP